MYLDEEKIKMTELRAIANALGMSSAMRLPRKDQLARAIERYIEKRESK